MKVLVTGGTGLVGSHAVAAITRGGHEVRLLARRPSQVEMSLGPLGVKVTDVVAGDVLDDELVSRAMDGCQAVVHAAAVFSTDPRRAAEIRRTNARAADIVLGHAVDRGLDPVVYVSSTVTLTRYGGSGPDLPLGDITLAYSESKIAAEKIARRLQEAGAPVVTVYPGAVLGPHDPYRGEQSERLRLILLGLFPLWPRGGMHTVDVRDTAAVIAAVLEPGHGPRRYVVPGYLVDGDQMYATVADVTGHRFVHLNVPALALDPSTRFFDAAHRWLPARWHYPADREGLEIIRRNTKLDDSPARTELGIEPTPFRQTMADTVRWLAESGRIPARRARKLGLA